MIAPVSPSPELRACCQCYITKPLTEFRPTLRGGTQRSTQCDFCHSKRERERRERNRDGKHRRRFSEFAKSISRTRDRYRVEYLVGAMVHCFGGVQGFVKAWLLNYAAAPSGSLARLGVFKAVMRMVEFTSASPTAVDEDNPIPPATHEELDRELHELFVNSIRRDPTEAVRGLRRLGWTVIPPGQQGACAAVPEQKPEVPSAMAVPAVGP